MDDIILSFEQSKADFFCPNLFNQSGTIIPSIVIHSVSISMWKAKRQGYQQQQPPDTTEQAEVNAMKSTNRRSLDGGGLQNGLQRQQHGAET